MSANYGVIINFSIYGQFGAMRKPDFGRMVCHSYIFINNNFYITKTENRSKKSLTHFFE